MLSDSELQLILNPINIFLLISSFDFLFFWILKIRIGDILKALKNETEVASISLVEQL